MSATANFTAILNPLGSWPSGPALFSKALGSIGKANPCHVSSGSKGGQFCATGGSKSSKIGPTGAVAISRVSGRVFSGEEVPVKNKLSKLEVGYLGEQIAAAYINTTQKQKAKTLNVKVNNFAVDMMAGNRVIEVKAGLVSNGKSAQQWRATIGQPGVKESAWLAKASPEKKKAWNERKQKRILERKEAAVQALAKQCRCKIETLTVTSIINPDKKTADVFVFRGFKLRTGWTNPAVKAAYVGTFKYSSISKAWAELIEKYEVA